MEVLVKIYNFCKMYKEEKNKLEKLHDIELMDIFCFDPDSLQAGVADRILKSRGWSHEEIRNFKK